MQTDGAATENALLVGHCQFWSSERCNRGVWYDLRCLISVSADNLWKPFSY